MAYSKHMKRFIFLVPFLISDMNQIAEENSSLSSYQKCGSPLLCLVLNQT